MATKPKKSKFVRYFIALICALVATSYLAVSGGIAFLGEVVDMVSPTAVENSASFQKDGKELKND